ncbi:MAG: hypothetical protein WCY32_01525 [Burkholderiaceae bacterium]
MSSYAGDTLLYRNRVFRLSVRPLETWFRLLGRRPQLRRPIHAAPGAADYSATWEICDDGLLRLVGLTGSWPNANPLALGHLFPFSEGSVVASWFNGTLRGMRVGPSGFSAALAGEDQAPGRADGPATRNALAPGAVAAGLAGLVMADLALELRAGRVLDADGQPVSERVVSPDTPDWTVILI